MNLIKRFGRKIKKYSGTKFENPALNLNCSEFEVNNWAISEFIIQKLVPIAGIHPYPITELNLMVAAVCRLRPQQVFEWGTNIGKSARIFHDTGKYFRIPLHIHSIDLPDDVEHNEHPKSDRGYMVRGLPDVTLHQADGLAKAIELYQKTPELSTLVFIDGDHSYESVFRELNGVIQYMPNANILLHDTFYQSEGAGYNIGPYKAISDTLEANPGKFKSMSTATGLPGMTLLYHF
jgi:cephalosporin hydroxylase